MAVKLGHTARRMTRRTTHHGHQKAALRQRMEFIGDRGGAVGSAAAMNSGFVGVGDVPEEEISFCPLGVRSAVRRTRTTVPSAETPIWCISFPVAPGSGRGGTRDYLAVVGGGLVEIHDRQEVRVGARLIAGAE